MRAGPASARVVPAFEPSLALPSVPRPAEGATVTIAAERTALHCACVNGHTAVVSLLIESKADIYIKNNDGKTPLNLQRKWRKELTDLYNTVNRAWLARKSLLFVLIGCGHVEGVSGGGEPVEEREQSAHERLRDEVLQSVNMSIMSYL